MEPLAGPLVGLQAVILSGGSGTRLWPLSREAYPKQFLSLFGEDSLLSQTLTRATAMDVCVGVTALTNEDHRFVVAAQLQQQMGSRPFNILLEPEGRNTAPAIALAALQLADVNADTVMLVMPSDHVIRSPAAFAQAVKLGLLAAQAGKLVTFGVIPESAHTGYGYIRSGAASDQGWSEIAAFVEKPDAKTAQTYLDDGGYYWNSGIFMFSAGRYLRELQQWRPDIVDACQRAWQARQADLDFIRVDRAAFLTCPADSIDYAVMEKTRDGVVVPLDAGWSDVGSWSALWELQAQDGQGNVCRGDVIIEDVARSYLHSEGRLIAAIGIQDHVIVETADVVLVAARDRVQDVKKLIAQIKAKDRQEHKFHRKVHRPWGSYEGVASGERFQVKRIVVKPGGQLSLQKHHHRAEHWVVVKGTATVVRGDETLLLTEDQSTYIPLGVLHRLANPGVIPLEVIEVQTGAYLGEDDIVRFEDRYNRTQEAGGMRQQEGSGDAAN